MGIRIDQLPDGHFAKTSEAQEAARLASEGEYELQIDSAYGNSPFSNGLAYVLYGPPDEEGHREAIRECVKAMDCLSDL